MPFLLFDFDGTIADTFEDSLEIYNRLADELQLCKVSRDEVEELRALSAWQILEQLEIPLKRVPSLVARGISELHGRMDRIKAIAGMPEVLNQLKKEGARLGILTSNSVKNVRKFLERGGLPDFEVVKQASRVFGKAGDLKSLQRKLKLRKGELIYVGDEKRDIEASQSAGVRVAAVTWGYNSKQGLQEMRPDFVFDSPAQLLELVAEE